MNKKSIIAREMSWLSFNARVLQEASDPNVSLKNRIRFLGIYSNNRDEFFRRRMAALKQLIRVNAQNDKDNLGKNPKKILDQIYRIILQQQEEFNRIWETLIEDLKKENVHIIHEKGLNAGQKKFISEYFDQEVRSSIIPLFIENMPKWPSYGDENVFLGIVMKNKDIPLDQKFAIIEIPKNHPRFIFLPSAPGKQNLILLEDLIRFNLPKLFSPLGYNHFEAHMFKVTKDAIIEIDHDQSTTLVQKIEKGVKNRRKANPISFLYDKKMNKELLKYLIRKLNLSNHQFIIPAGKIRNFRDFMNFPAILPNHQSRPLPFIHPFLAKAPRISDRILQQDILLHFPYHSFNSIIDLLCEAAMDSEVKSIKITAYRLASHSKICNALINAARTGKQVHIVLELRACFDEKANLEWKKKLEDEGVKVYLATPDLIVHAKICVIKKQVGNQIIQYGFIGTGNLNEKTALSYTDLFLLTAHRGIISDVNRVFKALENPDKNWHLLSSCKNLLVSPVNMRESLFKKIDDEIQAAKAGQPAKIIINLNSLTDEDLIKKLYKAAAAGVQIKMIIRGIFSAEIDRHEFLQPITALSIVDEYLEHSRILYFYSGGREDIYISSADWNERNLDHRIEVAVPIRDQAIKDNIKYLLEIKLRDNVKARKLESSFSNQYLSSAGKKKIQSQLKIYDYLKYHSLHKAEKNENRRD